MKKLLYFLFILLTYFFQQDCRAQKRPANPEALKYLDSAINILPDTPRESYLRKQIYYLDKATDIDSDFYSAYYPKVFDLLELKENNKAITAGKVLIRIRPKYADGYVAAGVAYEKNSNSILAKENFEKALLIYNKILDTLNSSNKKYKGLLMSKAIDLVLDNQQAAGDNIFKQLYDEEKDVDFKEMYSHFLTVSKEEILDRKFWEKAGKGGSAKVVEDGTGSVKKTP